MPFYWKKLRGNYSGSLKCTFIVHFTSACTNDNTTTTVSQWLSTFNRKQRCQHGEWGCGGKSIQICWYQRQRIRVQNSERNCHYQSHLARTIIVYACPLRFAQAFLDGKSVLTDPIGQSNLNDSNDCSPWTFNSDPGMEKLTSVRACAEICIRRAKPIWDYFGRDVLWFSSP